MRPKSAPDDHSAHDDGADEDDAEVPTGEGGSEEGEDAKEDAEMGARGVRVVCEAVEGRAWGACVYAYEGREGTRVERYCCADDDAPGYEEDDARDEGEREGESRRCPG